MTKQLLAVVLVTVVLSTIIGFVLGAATSPESSDAASTDTPVVKQLKRLNAQMNTLNSRIGDPQTAAGTVRGLLTIICDYTAPISCKP